MKEIGTLLKEKREENGLSIEEVAEDLNVKPSQVGHLEEGDMKAFKDVFYLKYFLRDYAKYLGLDYEKMVDEFNEFLFDYTSRIPIEEIEKLKKEKKEEPKDKVASPYTMTAINYFDKKHLILYLTVAVVLVVALILIF